MAERWPTEGLDHALAVLTGNTAAPTALYMGWFKSQTASTVPAANAVLSTQTGVTECAYTGYARVQIDPGEWAAAVALAAGTGRRRFASEQQLPQASAGATQETANGFFISPSSSGGVALYYSNFDEGAASIGEGDTPYGTPWLGLAE